MHPLFVHFPIALLMIYGLMELIPQKFIRQLSWWQGSKVFILNLGILSMIPTLIAGGMDSHKMVHNYSLHKIIEVHETFAQITFFVFFALWAGYTINLFAHAKWIARFSASNRFIHFVWRLKLKLAYIITKTPLRIILVITGITTLVITGSLGASIVYGPNIDPIVSFVYHLFF